MNKTGRTLKPEELKIIQKLDLSNKWNVGIHLLYLTGIRPAEVKEVVLNWIYEGKPNEELRFIPKKKRGKCEYRILNLNEELVKILEFLSPFVLSGEWNLESFKKYVQRFNKKNGTNITLKNFRTDWGTNVYSDSNDLILTQNAMGHTNSQTTQLYVKLSNIKAVKGTINRRTSQMYGGSDFVKDEKNENDNLKQRIKLLERENEALKAALNKQNKQGYFFQIDKINEKNLTN